MKIEDVKFLKMCRKDYEEYVIKGIPVENFSEWHEWMQHYWGKGISRKQFDKGCEITGDNRVKFKKLFGKCAFTFNGGHYFHCWLTDLGNAQVIILTAKDHGTRYEVVSMRNGKVFQSNIPRVLEFMDMISELK